MKESILQYLINDITHSMLSTANNDNRAIREHVFKDLKFSEVMLSNIYDSKRTPGAYIVQISSKVRNFNWEDWFSFKTRTLEDVLKKEYAEIKFFNQLQTKTNVNGLYFVGDKHKLVLMVDSLDEVNEDRIELPNCYLTKDLFTLDKENKIITVNHPYVKGKIEIVIRKKIDKKQDKDQSTKENK